jgi:LPXTG-motif cell wall-anchored protein
MVRPSLGTAALAAVLACASAAPAAAADGMLVAQLAQATPAPAPASQPPLTETAPGLQPTASGGGGSSRGASAGPGRDLPSTGSEAAIAALAGLGLLAAGAGLRLTVDDIVGP